MHKTCFFFPSHFNLMVLPLETVLYKFWGFFFLFQNFFEKQKIFSLCPGNKPIFGHVLHAYYTHELAWSGFNCENCTLWKSLHVNFDILWLLSILLSTSLLKSLCTHRHYPQEAPSLVGSRWPSGVRKLPCRDLWSSY